jgi:hypothetical protein
MHQATVLGAGMRAVPSSPRTLHTHTHTHTHITPSSSHLWHPLGQTLARGQGPPPHSPVTSDACDVCGVSDVCDVCGGVQCVRCRQRRGTPAPPSLPSDHPCPPLPRACTAYTEREHTHMHSTHTHSTHMHSTHTHSTHTHTAHLVAVGRQLLHLLVAVRLLVRFARAAELAQPRRILLLRARVAPLGHGQHELVVAVVGGERRARRRRRGGGVMAGGSVPPRRP